MKSLVMLVHTDQAVRPTGVGRIDARTAHQHKFAYMTLAVVSVAEAGTGVVTADDPLLAVISEDRRDHFDAGLEDGVFPPKFGRIFVVRIKAQIPTNSRYFFDV